LISNFKKLYISVKSVTTLLGMVELLMFIVIAAVFLVTLSAR